MEAADGTRQLMDGAVRDAPLDRENKSLHIEVHWLGVDGLTDAVAGYDPELVGHWGVVRIDLGDVEEELALPRREYKVGPGRSGFDADLVPDRGRWPSQDLRFLRGFS